MFHFELMECVPAPQLFSIVRLLLLSSGGAGREEGKEKESEKWPCILVCVRGACVRGACVRACVCVVSLCRGCMYPSHNSINSISPPTLLPQMQFTHSPARLIMIKKKLTHGSLQSYIEKKAYMLTILCYSSQAFLFLCLIN